MWLPEQWGYLSFIAFPPAWLTHIFAISMSVLLIQFDNTDSEDHWGSSGGRSFWEDRGVGKCTELIDTILGRISGPGPCWMTAWVILHFLNLCLLIWEIKTGLHPSQECHTLKWYNYGRYLVKSRDSQQWVGSSFWGQKKKKKKNSNSESSPWKQRTKVGTACWGWKVNLS